MTISNKFSQPRTPCCLLESNTANRRASTARFRPLKNEELMFMRSLKDVPVSYLFLALPNSTRHMKLEIDAYYVRVGWALLRNCPDDTAKLIWYWTLLLAKRERKYATAQRECPAVTSTVLMLRFLFVEAQLTIRTNYNSSKYIPNSTGSTGRLARWRLRFSKIAFDVVHCGGQKHQATNALCRWQTIREESFPLLNELPLCAVYMLNKKQYNVCILNA